MRLVLDTNVVIDWLVFDDPFLAAFRQQVLTGQVAIITHEPAITELRRVLGYKELKLDAERQATVLARYEAQTTKWSGTAGLDAAPRADAALPKNFPRCRDPDDNPFLELAWRAGAGALVSRDNAVLKLARRARKHGFQILDVPQLAAQVTGQAALSRP